jgi:hypothetical protein
MDKAVRSLADLKEQRCKEQLPASFSNMGMLPAYCKGRKQ